MRILGHEDAVHRLDSDHFDVLSLHTPSRRVRVYRRDDAWRCRSDRENGQDQPCAHILAALIDPQNRVARPPEVLDALGAKAGDFVAFEVDCKSAKLIRLVWSPGR